MRCIMQPVSVPITAGNDGWMKFTARLSYTTSSSLSSRRIDYTLNEGELILITDKSGRTQIVNPFYLNDVPVLTITSGPTNYNIQLCEQWISMSSQIALNNAVAKILVGTLEA